MNYSDYNISMLDLETYQLKKVSDKLDDIWNDITNRITTPALRKEAKNKGYIVVDNPDLEEDVIACYKMFQIPKASDELKKYVEENLYPFVVCMKD